MFGRKPKAGPKASQAEPDQIQARIIRASYRTQGALYLDISYQSMVWFEMHMPVQSKTFLVLEFNDEGASKARQIRDSDKVTLYYWKNRDGYPELRAALIHTADINDGPPRDDHTKDPKKVQKDESGDALQTTVHS